MPDLLDLLTESAQGGDALAARLGVGRVAVHARAHRLIEEGVPIAVTRRGYSVAPGTPLPGRFAPRGVFGRAYRYRGTVGSTQDEVRAWEGAPHGAVVFAERQTAGRGRRGRVWRTPGAALMCSVLLAEARPLADLALVPLAAGVALREACGVGALKWPNDLLAPDGRKLAGVLLEADVRGEEVRRAVLGVGLNVADPPEGAAALAEFRAVARVDLLADLLWSLEGWLARPAGDVLDAWRAHNATLGREVRVSVARGELGGVARDLLPDGSLLLDTPDGPARVAAGDVSLVAPLPSPEGPPERTIP